MTKAVIFDFNATLFYDDDLNRESWTKIYQKYLNKEIQENDEHIQYAISHNNRLNAIRIYKELNIDASEKQLADLSLEKEIIYTNTILEKNRTYLAEGSEKLMEKLKKDGYILNLCTASIAHNIDFFFEHLHLDRYFDKNLIGYDNGKVTDKYEMYQTAFKNIGVNPEECIVFEDQKASMLEAIKAGCKNIVYVNHYHRPTIDLKEIIQEINEYDEIDYSIFKK